MTYHYGRFRQIEESGADAYVARSSAMTETVAEAIAARRSLRYACLHCGDATAVISVFCSEECKSECLAQCGAGSTMGT